jgi:glyoxylase-like metal-dependent hydrolase (beta-lactamase superfamily II)
VTANVDDLWIEQLALGPMQNFVYVIGSRATREVALVDPAWDVSGLLEHLQQQDLRCVAALITHCHPDHVGGRMGGTRIEGLPALLERQDARIYVHRDEIPGVERVTGIPARDLVQVDSGERLRLGDVEIEFIHTPGHTPGSQCFKVRNALVSGDTLFIDGCGRVDFPGSNPDQMYESLQRLAALPEDTVLYPGHDYGRVPSDTLGRVKRSNYYLRVPDLASWRALMS